MTDISIITATYNAADTLPDCLDSISRQGIDVEHIVIDGGSLDGTLEIVDRYRESLSQVVSEPDQGIYDAMNKGLRLVTAGIVGILNADDYYPSENVLQQVIEVFSDPAIEACYGDLVYVGSNDTCRVTRYWRSGEYGPRKFYWGWMPPHPAFFVRRSVYEKYGLFKIELGSAADYEIMLRFLVKYRLKAVYIPRVLVHMRTGGVSNASLRNRIKANRMDRRAWEVNGMQPYPWTLMAKPLRKVGQWIVRK